MDEMKAAIEKSLSEFWDRQSLKVDDSDSVDDFVDELDSLAAVDALLGIEAIVGMHIPEASVIRKGGYESKQQFIEHLTAKVMAYVQGKKK
jgi:acyl carrier protein